MIRSLPQDSRTVAALRSLALSLTAALLTACGGDEPPATAHDLVIRNAVIYDGTGAAPVRGDVAVDGGRVSAIGSLGGLAGRSEVDAGGLALAPGFINVLSWANESLLVDGRGVSEIAQGVTLEIFGEGWSMGPLTGRMQDELREQQVDLHYDVKWKTLGGYLEHLERRGVSPNVASFVGAATVRIHELGSDDVAPDAEQLQRMQALVRTAMEEGALGVGSSLIYAPAAYASTAELTALVSAAAGYGGAYISHLRSEGDRLLEALDELIGIARATGVHAEVYHLKAAGQDNWPKMAQAIARIEQARRDGLSVSANMYPYVAGATGLDACMDPAIQAGGTEEWVERLQDEDTGAAAAAAMFQRAQGWENLCFAAGSPERVVLLGFREDSLKPLAGRTLADVARERGVTPGEAAVQLVIEDRTRVTTAFFLMSEPNVQLGLSQPWVSIGSDEGAQAPEGAFLLSRPHPRAYGSFARFLGHYVREHKVAPLADAIRRITSLPAYNFKLRGRGCIAPGCHADLVLFDPARIQDHADFANPQKLATGVRDVWVNGERVLQDGMHTGAKPGRFVRGPGWRGQ